MVDINNIFLIAQKESKESLKNRTVVESANYTHTGLYLNNQEYIVWNFKFFYEWKENMGFLASFGGGLTTELIARTPSISGGFYYRFGQKAELPE